MEISDYSRGFLTGVKRAGTITKEKRDAVKSAMRDAAINYFKIIDTRFEIKMYLSFGNVVDIVLRPYEQFHNFNEVNLLRFNNKISRSDIDKVVNLPKSLQRIKNQFLEIDGLHLKIVVMQGINKFFDLLSDNVLPSHNWSRNMYKPIIDEWILNLDKEYEKEKESLKLDAANKDNTIALSNSSVNNEGEINKTFCLNGIDDNLTKSKAATFADYLTDEGKAILPKLKLQYNKAKPQKMCFMLYALLDLSVLNAHPCHIDHTELTRILKNDFNFNGTRQGLNTQITILNYANSDKRAVIAQHRKKIKEMG